MEPRRRLHQYLALSNSIRHEKVQPSQPVFNIQETEYVGIPATDNHHVIPGWYQVVMSSLSLPVKIPLGFDRWCFVVEKNHMASVGGELIIVRSRQVLRIGEWHEIRAGKYGKRLYLWTDQKVSSEVMKSNKLLMLSLPNYVNLGK